VRSRTSSHSNKPTANDWARNGAARADVVLFAQTTSTSALIFSSTVRSQYASRHPSHSTPTVRPTDLAFSGHALVLSAVTLSQFLPRIWGWKYVKLREHREAGPTRPVRWLLLAAGISISGSIIAVLIFDKPGRDDSRWQWLDVVRLIVPFLATKRHQCSLVCSKPTNPDFYHLSRSQCSPSSRFS
jgi:hypothetical protein